jgi:hypothetical protein
MILVSVVLIAAAGVAAAVAAVARSPLRPGRYVVRRVPQSHAPLMSARLTRSHRALPGRPSAASTASRVHVITDASWRNPAPGRTERSQ